jgi:hypothetical protein
MAKYKYNINISGFTRWLYSTWKRMESAILSYNSSFPQYRQPNFNLMCNIIPSKVIFIRLTIIFIIHILHSSKSYMCLQ